MGKPSIVKTAGSGSALGRLEKAGIKKPAK